MDRIGRTVVAAGHSDSRRPGYIELFQKGLLAERAGIFKDSLESCHLCPRCCGVNRNAGKLGPCGVDARPRVASMNIHLWEEPPLSGSSGSGTIFFTGCTLKCLFCQNYPISQMGVGRYLSVEELAAGMLRLQKRGAQNLNLVTPTHQIAAFVQALVIAVPLGLRLPIVYNSSGYETLETLKLLEGIVDIYLPDIKYADSRIALMCSRRADYVTHNRIAIKEMWRQVGGIQMSQDGLAFRGLLIRHLVLPGGLAGTKDCLSFLVHAIGHEVWISLMNQYFPAHEALHTPPLDRKVTREEYQEAFEILAMCGCDNGFVQEFEEDQAQVCF
jgi:putative pyruvate formate lyase activating enzyme